MSYISTFDLTRTKFYLLEIGEFQTVVGGFIDIVDRLAKQVEQEKMMVWNARL